MLWTSSLPLWLCVAVKTRLRASLLVEEKKSFKVKTVLLHVMKSLFEWVHYWTEAPRPHKCVFKSIRKRSKIFSPTLAFWVLFSHVHTMRFVWKRILFDTRFSPSSTVKRPKTLMEMTEFDAFFGTVFKSLRFHLSTPETKRRVFKRLHFSNRLRKPPFS